MIAPSETCATLPLFTIGAYATYALTVENEISSSGVSYVPDMSSHEPSSGSSAERASVNEQSLSDRRGCGG